MLKIIRHLKLLFKGVPFEVVRMAGENFYCGKNSFFRPNEDIKIGSNVFIGNNVHIAAPCCIKDNVMLASYVSFVGGDHQFETPCILVNSSGRAISQQITIEEDVWVGHGSIIMSGVKIGRGSIIAAGSIVTKNVPECTIWGGVPAKHIRDRFNSFKDKNLHLLFLENRYR